MATLISQEQSSNIGKSGRVGEKIAGIYIAGSTFFASLFAQEGLPSADVIKENGFAVWTSIALVGGVICVFRLYSNALNARITTLENEINFYREKLFREYDKDKKSSDKE